VVLSPPLPPLNIQAVSKTCASEKARKTQTGHVDTILAFNPHVELRTMIKRRLKEDINLHYMWRAGREALVRTLAWTMDFVLCVDVLYAYFCRSLGLNGVYTLIVGPCSRWVFRRVAHLRDVLHAAAVRRTT